MRVVLASRNPGKLAELNTLLSPLSLSLESQQAHDVPSPPETGTTFIENAIIKARTVAAATGLAALADDSGLVVPALDGAPGIYSARYASRDTSDSFEEEAGIGKDHANNQKLIAKLQGVSDRTAYFYCAIVFLRHAIDPTPLIATAAWHGQIVDEPRGDHGFGYDPHFYVAEFDKTSAELPRETKNAISHRGLAIGKLIVELNERI
jgi:XTP/dITP diphosphohydrolase